MRTLSSEPTAVSTGASGFLLSATYHEVWRIRLAAINVPWTAHTHASISATTQTRVAWQETALRARLAAFLGPIIRRASETGNHRDIRAHSPVHTRVTLTPQMSHARTLRRRRRRRSASGMGTLAVGSAPESLCMPASHVWCTSVTRCCSGKPNPRQIAPGTRAPSHGLVLERETQQRRGRVRKRAPLMSQRRRATERCGPRRRKVPVAAGARARGEVTDPRPRSLAERSD